MATRVQARVRGRAGRRVALQRLVLELQGETHRVDVVIVTDCQFVTSPAGLSVTIGYYPAPLTQTLGQFHQSLLGILSQTVGSTAKLWVNPVNFRFAADSPRADWLTSPKRCSHSDVPLYILLVIIHTKYTGYVRMTLTFRARADRGGRRRSDPGTQPWAVESSSAHAPPSA
jgi:hypothetical protein